MTISSLSRPNVSNDRQEINNGLILPYWEVCGCVRVYSKGFVKRKHGVENFGAADFSVL